MSKLSLSFSAIETFKTCPRKYFYSYLQKLPKKIWPWFTFGNFNHLVLEKFHSYTKFYTKRNREYKPQELMKRAFYSALRRTIRRSSHTIEPVLTEKQIDESKILLKRYIDKVKSTKDNTLFVEKYFVIDLGDDMILRGYIDRVDQIGPKSFKIVDYKTSKASYVHDKNNQLDIYAIGLKQVLDEKDVEIWKQLDFIKIGKTSPSNPEGAKHDDREDAEILEIIKNWGMIIREKREKDSDDVSKWEAKENDFCWCCDFKVQCDESRGLNKLEEFTGYE